jgi:hypothetical protein
MMSPTINEESDCLRKKICVADVDEGKPVCFEYGCVVCFIAIYFKLNVYRKFDKRPFSFKNILKRSAKRLWLNFTLN